MREKTVRNLRSINKTQECFDELKILIFHVRTTTRELILKFVELLNFKPYLTSVIVLRYYYFFYFSILSRYIVFPIVINERRVRLIIRPYTFMNTTYPFGVHELNTLGRVTLSFYSVTWNASCILYI